MNQAMILAQILSCTCCGFSASAGFVYRRKLDSFWRRREVYMEPRVVSSLGSYSAAHYTLALSKRAKFKSNGKQEIVQASLRSYTPNERAFHSAAAPVRLRASWSIRASTNCHCRCCATRSHHTFESGTKSRSNRREENRKLKEDTELDRFKSRSGVASKLPNTALPNMA